MARWSGFRLSFLGRAHVAKQVLMFIFTHHATFVPVPADILRQFCTSVYTFFSSFVMKKAHMSIDANHISPPKDS